MKSKYNNICKKVKFTWYNSDFNAEYKNPERKRGKSVYTRDAYKYINNKEQNNI